MIYSDTTNKNGVIQRYERYHLFDDGVVSGDSTLLKQVTSDVNEIVHELTTEIMLLQDSFDWDDPNKTDYPIATTPLVASQRDYQFDSISFLKLKRIDISYDGTTYYRATAFDSSSYMEGLGSDSLTDAEFTKTEPYYDPKAFGFWLYPRADATDVANGGVIRIEYSRGHTEYQSSDTDKEAPIDRNFQDLIPMGAALRSPNLSVGQYNKLLPLYERGKEKMVQHYANRNEDNALIFQEDIRSNYS